LTVVAAALTVCVPEPREVLKLVSPLYTTVIDCVPTGNTDVTKDPDPLLSVAVPSTVEPKKPVTVPVGVPPPGDKGLTATLNVTFELKVEGLGVDEIMATVVSDLITFCTSAGEVEVKKLVSPLYCAVKEFAPKASVEVI